MKIKVQFTVDVNPDVWCDAYGVDRADVRDDVREYARNAVTAWIIENGYGY